MQNYSSNVADPAGNAVAFAMISIFNLDGTPATLFSNSTGTAPLPNPFPADAFGRFNLFAANGAYKGTAAGNGILGVSFQFQLYDPNDAPPATLATLAASGGAAKVGTADGSTVQAKLTALDTGKAVLEQAATFATVSSSTVARFVSVAADETNNGQQTLYFHNGSSLNWIPTQGV